jgi:protein-tyrosine phosphatase
LTKTNVLIYSENLQSRTALIVAAYLMREEHMSAKAATETIKKKRRAISIN